MPITSNGNFAGDRAHTKQRDRSVEAFRIPLHKMVLTSPTELWNDSCSARDLKYAIEHRAVGATSNPTIVMSVLQQDFAEWKKPILHLFDTHPDWTEAQIAWELIEQIAVRGAALLRPAAYRSHLHWSEFIGGDVTEQFGELRKAFDPKGLKQSEFDTYGATARTLRGFLGSYYELVGFLRDMRLPNPDA